jgi:hypothetical protein
MFWPLRAHLQVEYTVSLERQKRQFMTTFNRVEISVNLHVVCQLVNLFVCPPVWSSGQNSFPKDQVVRVRFPALPDSLRSSESGLVSTIEELLVLENKVSAPSKKTDYGQTGSAALTRRHLSIRKSSHQLRRQALVARSE